jgi:hypothetical protein
LTLKYKLPKETSPKQTNESEGVEQKTAILVAKTFDPVGGACIKYETNRAVEVGRLMLGFQELGQLMQNVPVTVTRKASGGEEMAVYEPATATAEGARGKAENTTAPAPAQGGGGGKKKAKNKR